MQFDGFCVQDVGKNKIMNIECSTNWDLMVVQMPLELSTA